MRVAVVPGPPGAGQGGLLRELDEAGSPISDAVVVPDLAVAMRKYEQAGGVRWVWSSALGFYSELLLAGVRVARCHDVALADALLTARDEALNQVSQPAEAVDAGRAMLRAADAQRLAWASAHAGGGTIQDALFEDSELTASASASFAAPDPGPGQADASLTEQLNALIAVHADQLRRIAADEHPQRFAMLVAADSAGG